MRMLLDASALVNLVKRGEISQLSQAQTLDLAIYEALNAVWKEHHKLKKISMETAAAFASLLQRAFNIIDKTSIEGIEEETFHIACKHGITIHDASYVAAALKRNLPLVTDDRRLAEKISGIVRTKSSREIQNII
ncbi:MAG: type II toxin-antitoxin system VapC family toxin [Candidatus Bathyarchaeia archaeon]